MAYKIAIGGIHIESSTFTPYVSTKRDFKIKRGEELLNSYPWLKSYDSDIKCIPLVYARALPGGVVSRNFYEEWLSEFILLLKEAMKENIDALLFDIHGAMSIEGMMDAEGEIAKVVREIVGEEVVISTTMDLHGNVSDELFCASDLLTCYRTAPHIDAMETRKRAFDNLLYAIEFGREKIVKAKVDIPILLPGEKTSTEVEPGKSLYASIDEICDNPSIIDVAIWMGFPWADQPRCHSVIVITGIERITVKQKIEELAIKYWNLRYDFKFVGPVANTEDAIEEALSSDKTPFFISDTGDNPGAGGSGDMNLLLKRFLEINKLEKIEKKILFSSIFDPESIERIYNNEIGNNVWLNLGGKIDLSYGGPLEINAKIEFLFYDNVAGKSAVVMMDNIFIIITENRYQYGTHDAFTKANVRHFTDFDIIVVKMGYLEPDLSEAAKGWVMALTPGAVSQDMDNIHYSNLKRPLFPLDSNDFNPKFTIKF